MKSKIIFAALCLCLLDGCSTGKEQIIFSSEPSALQGTNTAAVLPQPKKLEKADGLKVREAVFGYLLSRHFWDDGGYSAVFLQGDDDEVGALIKKFSDHIPPIKPSYRADLPPNRAPVDRDTGRAAMILSVSVGEPNADDSVDALGRWYAGGAVSGFYSFVLRKSDGSWKIESVK